MWPLAVALMALGGCDEPASVATAPPARFDFKMIDTGSIDVAAHEGSAPLAGVLAHGAFAPSAQVITSVTGLRSLDLSFERTP